MQRIERYGVIALLLLLVTVLAVSMWGGDQVQPDPSTPTLASAPARSRVDESKQNKQQPRRAPRRETPRTQNKNKSRVDQGLPLTPTKRPEDLAIRHENATRKKPATEPREKVTVEKTKPAKAARRVMRTRSSRSGRCRNRGPKRRSRIRLYSRR